VLKLYPNERDVQAKLRCSNWKCRIEVGRRWNIPKFDSLSDLCCNDIDTELHYLFECHSHKIKEIQRQRHSKLLF